MSYDYNSASYEKFLIQELQRLQGKSGTNASVGGSNDSTGSIWDEAGIDFSSLDKTAQSGQFDGYMSAMSDYGFDYSSDYDGIGDEFSSSDKTSKANAYQNFFGIMSNMETDYSNAYKGLMDNFYSEVERIQAEEEAEAAEKARLEAEKEAAKKAEAEGQAGSTGGGTTGGGATGGGVPKLEDEGTPKLEDEGAPKIEDEEQQQTTTVERKQEVREGFDAELIASSLKSASEDGIFGWGTHETTFKKYFEGTSNYPALNDAEIAQVAAAYESQYGESLEDMVRGEFSFKIEDKYVSKIQKSQEILETKNEDGTVNKKYVGDYNAQEVDEKFLKSMATKFHDATVGMWGTDEEAVWQVMNLEPAILKQVIEYYNNSPLADKKDFEKAIRGDFTFGQQSELLELYDKAQKAVIPEKVEETKETKEAEEEKEENKEENS